MAMTMAEKILARHAGREAVTPGEYLWCDVDAASGLPLDVLERHGIGRLHDAERTFHVEDHLAPPPTVDRANLAARRRRAALGYGVGHYFELGRHGILHQVFAEHGMFAPGELVAMRDSHATSGGVFNAAVTSVNADSAFAHILGMQWFRVPPSIRVVLEGAWPPSEAVVGKDISLHLTGTYGTDFALYRSVEVTGPAVAGMSLASRWTIANMGVELGAKFTIFEHDTVTAEFLAGRVHREFTPVTPDPGAVYEQTVRIDVAGLEPLVACPHDPGNVATAASLESQRITVDQAFIGSCTNGRLEDYALAARILRGRQVHPRVRLLCSPASQHVWKEVLRAGLWDTFADAGALIEHSTCGPCFGGHMGVLGDGEVAISASNRNFQGRQGSPASFVYLANPAVVAAAAVAGRIVDPRNFL
jgi:3-isopropylmalate/(R)-2-methylmalate dehydratase large subunit